MTMNPEVWEISYWELSIRIVIALVLGGLIGLERELGDHPAGFRTHILVCVGSALIVLLSSYGFSQFAFEANVRMDPARLAAQVISGIGFLGAGTIMRTGATVAGLTTAASLWVVAAIGLAVGAGFYYGAALSTVAVLVSLFVLNKVDTSVLAGSQKKRSLSLEVPDGGGHLGRIATQIKEMGAVISDMQVENRQQAPARDGGEGNKQTMHIQMMLKSKKDVYEKLVLMLAEDPHILRLGTSESTPVPDMKKNLTSPSGSSAASHSGPGPR
ncbi:MgtC/SapB family protein [Paenibacillus puerhi]|uniref:MgtC/SapB family protein n=1 Tax=Paenibacillus puerhi TaxID=2692622 RepID=UPI0038B2522E